MEMRRLSSAQNKMATLIPCRLAEGCEDLLPRKQHDDDAAFDLRSRVALTLAPGQYLPVPTGLFLALPTGWEAQVRPRSGLACKAGVTVLNSPGTIDAGYRGEVQVILINHSQSPFQIARGDRIAQMVIQKLSDAALQPTAVLDETARGAGGFGSTGVS